MTRLVNTHEQLPTWFHIPGNRYWHQRPTANRRGRARLDLHGVVGHTIYIDHEELQAPYWIRRPLPCPRP